MKKKNKSEEITNYDKLTDLRREEAREVYYWMNVFPGSTREELLSLFALGDETLFNRELAWLESEEMFYMDGDYYYLDKDYFLL